MAAIASAFASGSSAMPRAPARTRRRGFVFALDIEGTRTQSRSGEAQPQHRALVGLGWNLAGNHRHKTDLAIRIEASRIDTANDNRAPEDRIGLSVTARW